MVSIALTCAAQANPADGPIAEFIDKKDVSRARLVRSLNKLQAAIRPVEPLEIFRTRSRTRHRPNCMVLWSPSRKPPDDPRPETGMPS
jgi:hypothetical protein